MRVWKNVDYLPAKVIHLFHQIAFLDCFLK